MPGIRHRHLEQVGALSQDRAHQQSAVGVPVHGELPGRSVALCDQVLRRGNEVVKAVLLSLQTAGAVPLLAVLPAPAEVGHGIEATQLQPE